jgi:hypothetical protein
MQWSCTYRAHHRQLSTVECIWTHRMKDWASDNTATKCRRHLTSDAGAVLAAFAYTSLSGIIASNFFLQGRCSFSCASISTDLFKDCQFMTKRRVCAEMFLTESILISVLISAVARVDRFRCRSCPVAVLHKTQGPFSRVQSSA